MSASNPTLSHILISNNTGNNAGGIYAMQSNPLLDFVTITQNTHTGGSNVGGLYLHYSNFTIILTLCLLTWVIFSKHLAHENLQFGARGAHPFF